VKSKERRRLLQLLLISLVMVLLLRRGIRVGRGRVEGTRGKDALGRGSGKHVSCWWLMSRLHVAISWKVTLRRNGTAV